MSISIITAVSRESDWLRIAAQSVEELSTILGSDYAVQWVLASDGPSIEWIADQTTQVVSASKVYVESPNLSDDTVGRGAIVRNGSLEYCTERFIGALDDDDYLDAENYAAMIKLAINGDYKWVAGMYRSLVGDELYPVAQPPFVGEIPVGAYRNSIEAGWQPFVGAAAIMDRELLVSLGGWPALAYHQDAQLWLDCTDKVPGFMIADSVYIWRRHNSQMTPLGTDMGRDTRPRLWV